jgi:hypothetical protein
MNPVKVMNNAELQAQYVPSSRTDLASVLDI